MGPVAARIRASSDPPAIANSRSNTQRMVSTVGPASTCLPPTLKAVRILPPGAAGTFDHRDVQTR
jgi:hypothetical protein